MTHIGDGVDAREQADHADKGGENGVDCDADLDELRCLGREQGRVRARLRHLNPDHTIGMSQNASNEVIFF